MKTKRNFILLIAYIVIAITISILEGCIYNATPSYTKGDKIYNDWRAEQKAITQKQLDYANSPAFKAKYGGTSKGNSLPGAKANSVIGTTADPYHIIRQPNMGVPGASIGVTIYK